MTTNPAMNPTLKQIQGGAMNADAVTEPCILIWHHDGKLELASTVPHPKGEWLRLLDWLAKFGVNTVLTVHPACEQFAFAPTTPLL